MSAAPLPPCSVLILAGGRGQRMGGQDKGLLPWHGKPLIAHLHAVVRPLSDDLIISCNRNPDAYRHYADTLVHDQQPDYPGPLAGVLAGLAVARHERVLVLACDAPQVDRALLHSLVRLAEADAAVMVCQGGQWQPMFSLIPRSRREALAQAWADGERSLLRALRNGPLLALACADDDPRLANFNTPQHLAEPGSTQP